MGPLLTPHSPLLRVFFLFQITKHLQTYLGPVFRVLTKKHQQQQRQLQEQRATAAAIDATSATQKGGTGVAVPSSGDSRQEQEQEGSCPAPSPPAAPLPSAASPPSVTELRDGVSRYRGARGDAAAIGELLGVLGSLARALGE